jgi:hypothetical protein
VEQVTEIQVVVVLPLVEVILTQAAVAVLEQQVLLV